MRVLGIESSCDETSASVVEDGHRLLSLVTASSMDLHAIYGGVVPEIAARSHIEFINPVIEDALSSANCDWKDIDAIAVTYGPGLGGSLLIGVLAARTLAIIKKKPLYRVDHVLAHAYANFITETSLAGFNLPKNQPLFPALALIVSGGHSQLVFLKDHFNYSLLGQTSDDAIGEAFDKVAKILGLPYPGGPSVSALAKKGDPCKYKLPVAKVDGKYGFSFSGPKTAVLRLAQREAGGDFTLPSSKIPNLLSSTQKPDIAASFQYSAIKTVVDKTIKATLELHPKSVIIGGGVSANQELRSQLHNRLADIHQKNPKLNTLPIEYTDIKLCTDNGAMIATLGCFIAERQLEPADPYTLTIKPSLSM